MRKPMHSHDQRCGPLHAHHPYGTRSWPVEHETAPGPSAPLRFTGEDWTQSFSFLTFCLFYYTSIPKAEDPFPLLFEPDNFFICFFQEILINEFRRPFDRV